MIEDPKPHDRAARAAWLRALEWTAPIARDPGRTLPIVFDALAQRYGEAPAIESAGLRWTFRELAQTGHRIARWALEQGIRPGEPVGLLMPNRPEYLAVWLGLTRIGAVVALLNTNQRGYALTHSLRVASVKRVVVDAELEVQLSDALNADVRTPAERPQIQVFGASAGNTPQLDARFADYDGAPLTAEECGFPQLADRALYIYTSGTTGLPKAATVTHHRLMQWSHWFAGLVGVRESDRMYNCLPMYHSVGGVVATTAVLVGGGSVVLRRRFSAGDFWRDVTQEQCTLVQYIGELCRYLVNRPFDPVETRHSLRAACGNGLRAEVWTEFQRRFRVPEIIEYYASTEGNFSLFNVEGKVGSVGRIPPFLAHRIPVSLVKFDFRTGMPLRDAQGRCVACAVDEAGEAIGKIPKPGENSGGRFEGYTDAGESERKILRDVFEAGDAWYRTGDLMRRDAQGFFYFVDRTGDTFRWKGENVSCAEVAAALRDIDGVLDAVVYGVTVPETDGKAGMAALVVKDGFDLREFRKRIAALLPSYARPLFLRLASHIETTGTFKPSTFELAADGYDPAAISDPLYFDDGRTGAYVPVDAALLAALRTGRLRL